MGEYDRQIKSALKLIAKKGQSVIWKEIRNGAPVDPAQPWKPSEQISPVEHAVKICFIPLTKEMRESIFYSVSEVPSGAVVGLMGSVNFEASLKDVVITDGKELRIENINILSPNGQVILHTVLFKK
jgi:hypothetical protein